MTLGTFKMKKVDLQKAGIEDDGNSIVYYLSATEATYKCLRSPLNELVKSGELKL